MEAIRENETAMRYLDTVKDRLIVAEDIAKAVEERALKGAKFLIIAKKQEQLAPLKAEILKTPGLSAVFSGSWSVDGCFCHQRNGSSGVAGKAGRAKRRGAGHRG